MRRKLTTLSAATAATLLGGALALTGCSADQDDSTETTGTAETIGTTESSDHGDHGDHADMDHGDHDDHSHMDHPADGGPAPDGIVEAADPEYPVGSEVILNTDHMPGMDGATATVVGAFDTYTYSVSYTPSDGGAPVEDHKWVVQEELADAGSDRLADGDTVVLDADHMAGMQGVEATIDSSTDETVYMVDYEADGMSMTNHKWVVESEISPAE